MQIRMLILALDRSPGNHVLFLTSPDTAALQLKEVTNRGEADLATAGLLDYAKGKVIINRRRHIGLATVWEKVPDAASCYATALHKALEALRPVGIASVHSGRSREPVRLTTNGLAREEKKIREAIVKETRMRTALLAIEHTHMRLAADIVIAQDKLLARMAEKLRATAKTRVKRTRERTSKLDDVIDSEETNRAAVTHMFMEKIDKFRELALLGQECALRAAAVALERMH
jgi:hypothetical protein